MPLEMTKPNEKKHSTLSQSHFSMLRLFLEVDIGLLLSLWIKGN